MFQLQLKAENIIEIFVKAEKRQTTSPLMTNMLIDEVMQGIQELVEKVMEFRVCKNSS